MRARLTTINILRLFFLILCAVGGWAISDLFQTNDRPIRFLHGWGFICGVAAGMLFIGVDYALKGFSLRGFTAATFGLVLGSIVAYLIGSSPLLTFLDKPDYQQLKSIIQIVVFLGLSYLGMVMALRGKDEFNLIIPYVRFTPTDTFQQLLVVDTSVIIDGRIADICETGFIEGTLVVPRFVLRELQYVADSSDPLKRGRGRRGLDILGRMQKNPKIDIKIHENDIPEVSDVDAKLVVLAKMLSAKVITNDYNLNKISEIQKVRVLNINDLANVVRAILLPGEELSVRLVKEGKDGDQSVAYLPDGTMIVVNQSRRLMGQQVLIVVSSVLQTSAGRMVFAELKTNMVNQTDRSWDKRDKTPSPDAARQQNA